MAVRTRAQLNADATVNLPDNESGDIDAVHVRDRVKDLADSALLPEDVGAAAGTVAAGNDARFPVMPHDFTSNVGIGNATKDTEALLAWADYISYNNVGKARLSGKAGATASFRLEAPLIIGPSGGTIHTRLIECNATIQAVAPLEDMLHLRNIWGSAVLGRLQVLGTGGSTLSSNTCIHGIRIAGAGSARLGYLTAKNFKGWGIRNTGGNVHFASIAGVDVAECGAKGGGARDFPVTVTGFARTGGAGNGNQRSVLTIDDPANLPPPAVLPTWGFVIVNKFPHKITAVDYTLGTISVFPWLHGDDEVPGVFQLMFGGGLRLGGQSAQTTVDSMVSVRNATAVWLWGVGTPVLKGFGSNHDGNGIVLGDTHLSVFGGATITGAYFEATGTAAIIHLPQTSSSSNGSLISGITSLARSQIFSPWARSADGVQSTTVRYFPVTMLYRNQIWFPWSDNDVRNDDTGLQTSATLSNVPRPWPRAFRHSYQPFTVNLEDEPQYRRLKGNAPIIWIMYGRGAGKGTGGGYKRTLRINAGTGKTINGVAQVVEVEAQENPIQYCAVLEDDGSGPNIWRVTMTEALPIPGTEATPTYPGNITDLDVVASTPSSLTVEFTEATAADYYEYRISLNNTPEAWGGEVLLPGSAASGTFTGTVEGLAPNEIYDVQVRGYNDNGPGEWSNTAIGSTVIAPSTITDLTVPRTTISSAILRFSPSINAASYQVRHSVTTENEWIENDLGVIEFGALLEGEVEGLEENETYDFQVRGVIGDVVGDWSNLVTATAEVTFPGDIDDLDIVATTYESFTLEFTESTNADLGYQVRYSVTTLNDWSEVTLSGSASGGVFTGILSDLSPGITYDVQVRGLNAEGPGEWSNLVTGATSSLLHYQIDTFTGSGTWTAPDDVELVDYAEGWAAGGGSSYSDPNRMGGGGSAYARTANIEVTPETGYTVTVAPASTADNDGGDSSFIDSSTLLVKGGKAGINGRTGGQASECVGDVKYDGGTGGTNTTGQTFGGAAAGDQSAASGGLPGERQPAAMLASGATRTVPGGGAATNTSPGGGARGEIRLHYKRPVPSGFPPVVSRNWGRIPNATGITTTHSINMPPNIAVGNLLLAWVAFRAAPDLTIPGDWTVLAEVANGTNNKGVLVYKFAEGGDSLTITSSSARFSSHLTWQLATAGVPTAVTSSGTGGGGTPNIDPPSLSPAAGSDKYLWLALGVQGAGNSNVNNYLAPTNYGSFNYLNQQHSGNAVSILSAERFLEASSEDPAAFTSSSSNAWVAATVAIPFVEVEPPAAEFEFLGTVLSTDNLTTYTFTGVPIGAASEDRRVIIPVGGGGNTNAIVTAASIGGHTADVYSMTDSGSRLACATISAVVPAGTTATVTVTFAAAQQRCSLHVHRARKLQSGVPVDWVADHAHATVMEAELEAEKGGFIIAGSMYGNTANTNHHVSCASRAFDTTGTKEISVERTAIDNVEWTGLDQDSDVFLEAHDSAIGNFVTLAATSWR